MFIPNFLSLVKYIHFALEKRGMKLILNALFSLVVLTKMLVAANSVEGFWKTVNEDGVAQSIIAVYEHNGVSYGRIIATFSESEPGTIDDSIYNPVKRAPGVIGQPPYSGLDIIWGLENTKWTHKGHIMDPQRGKVYRAELWTEGPDLIVRGKLLMFGRSQKWYAVTPKDLPSGFKLPDLKSLVPSIPQVK